MSWSSVGYQRERRLQGVGVSFGIAIGPAYVIERGALRVPEYQIDDQDIGAECARFDGAVDAAKAQLRDLQTKARNLSGAAAEEFGFLLDAHTQMLAGSRLIRGVKAIISAEKLNGEAAIAQTLVQIEADFRTIDDPYIAARIADVKEVGARLLRNLMDKPTVGFDHAPLGSVIIADEITPSDTALMSPSRLAGFASVLGGAEGHTAIMARSLGLSAVLGVPGLLELIRPGELVIIDGTNGDIIVDPSDVTLESYRAKQHAFQMEKARLAAFKGLAAETQDGVVVQLKANMELPGEIAAALDVGAEGVGLLRSEFMFMNRPDLPGEDEQYETLRHLLVQMNGAPLTVRTLDVGADKLIAAVSNSAGGGADNDLNPALGLRAIRFALKNRTMLETQLAAMLRAATYGPLRILLPMITAPDEVMTVRAILADVVRTLQRRGVDVPHPLPPLGVMIEVPAAALAADALARVSDFFSIGTNDLTMYTLAIDRGNEQVAHLYDPLNPAVLRLIQFTAEAARRADIPVNICGEMAGDERFTALLLGLGLSELSMAPQSLPRIKRRIRALDYKTARDLAGEIMMLSDRQHIAGRMIRFNRDLDHVIAAVE